MKLNFADWKAQRGQKTAQPKVVIIRDHQDTRTWFPEDWSRELATAEVGTPARSVADNYTRIVRAERSVMVYSSFRRGVVEVFHPGSSGFHVICANTTLARYMQDRSSYNPGYRRSVCDTWDVSHLANDIFGGMISAGFF